ncbi:hypothetical protein SRHO_G00124390 [Serrasalmus rhombeus]
MAASSCVLAIAERPNAVVAANLRQKHSNMGSSNADGLVAHCPTWISWHHKQQVTWWWGGTHQALPQDFITTLPAQPAAANNRPGHSQGGRYRSVYSQSDTVWYQ